MKATVALALLALLVGCGESAERKKLADQSPSLRSVLAKDSGVSINFYPDGRWQVIDMHGICPDGGYGPTVEAAAKDCLDHPIPYLEKSGDPERF